ncbi:MAG: ATP-binding protein [Pseudomonadota bacterium]
MTTPGEQHAFNRLLAELACLPALREGNARLVCDLLVERALSVCSAVQGALWVQREGRIECLVSKRGEPDNAPIGGARTEALATLDEAAVGRLLTTLGERRTLATQNPEARLSAAIFETGQICGVLLVEAQAGREWSPAEEALMGSLADIAAQVLLAQQKRRSDEALVQAQRLDALGSLAGGVAHEFRNLLTVMNGGLELTLQRELGEDARDLLKLVADTGARAEKLTERLLAFGRGEPLAMRATDLRDVLTGVQSLAGRVIREEIEQRFELPDIPCWVSCDGERLEQVVMNLLLNAAEAMPSGGSVSVRLLAGSDEHRILVQDTGPGVPEADQAHLFEPLFSTKSGAASGLGLGLPVSLGIVQQHGGAMQLDGSGPDGSTFRIELPARKAPMWRDEADIRVAEPRTRSQRVLLVEDDAAVRDVVGSMLKRLGYDALIASDAADALAALQRNADIAVLMTDVVLPDVRGTELYRLARVIDSSLRVLFISGYDHSTIGRSADGHSGAAFLAKPFTAAELEQALYTLLDGAGGIQVDVR